MLFYRFSCSDLPIRILAETLAIPIEFFHNFTQLVEVSAGLV
jgi:hypothetical protein